MLEALILVAILLVSSFFQDHPIAMLTAAVVVVLLLIQFVRVIAAKGPPFVPTRHRDVRTMIAFADIRSGEIACDLGCGDGRIVRAAARKGAIATGYELSFPTYVLATILSLRTKNVFIRYGNFWKESFAETDILFCFLLKKPMVRFSEEIWPTLKPGTRVVTYMFKVPGVPVVKEEGQVRLQVK